MKKNLNFSVSWKWIDRKIKKKSLVKILEVPSIKDVIISSMIC